MLLRTPRASVWPGGFDPKGSCLLSRRWFHPLVERLSGEVVQSLVAFREKLRHGDFSLNYFTYFILARARYYLLGRRHLPFHVYWFPRKELEAVGTRLKKGGLKFLEPSRMEMAP